MNSKKIAIIAIVILAIVIALLGAAYVFNLFGSTTDFDTKFISGTFSGEVSQNKIKDNSSIANWTASYEDKEHNITYNMSCVKDGSFITDLYRLQGLEAPEVRKYNNQSWKIFYSQAVPSTNGTNNSSASSNDTINVYICEADINDTAYTISVIAYNNETECDGTLFCPLYKDYIEPLIKSVSFKDSKKAPQMYNVLNMSKEEFEYNKKYLDNLLSGNVSSTE
ncbi:hypothetical protein [Methanobrevibacter olleyae]|uniref:Uncharacterized protein n=1 Tax=Methanobrevibacter olleyae TaxID=294671 RepID=A0A126R120_METOL|nr:hypothetical protein [Methanobrevibacter olleyae]AMK15325.1 hypothetical protein YLM1_0768 [Methanobrevibacter olleyae]SFL30025.1 hypothetical protein SAMN02910297_00511 [Methanobrevibacter olleyae]